MSHVPLIIREFPEANLAGNYYPCQTMEAKGAVLIGCAMGITQNYYHHFAEFLCESGYNVLTFDFRGTGHSRPKRLRGYTVSLFDWVDDIKSALIFLKGTSPNQKMIFVGHSIASQLFGFVENNSIADHVIFLASSTGYWKEGRGAAKWKNLFLLAVVMPFSNIVWGFTNAKLFGQGENYPKGPSLHWRRWCLRPTYFEPDLTAANNFFPHFTGSITSFYFTDDAIANEVNTKRLLDFYSNSKTRLIAVRPSDMQQHNIGHSGFLSRKFRSTLWQEIVRNISHP